MTIWNENPYNNFARRLRNARETRGLSQTELAKKIGMQPSQISHYETSDRKPALLIFSLLAFELNVSADYLLGRSEKMLATPKKLTVLQENYSRLSYDNQFLVDGFIELLFDQIEMKEDEESLQREE